jgi:hypothetical protein
MPLETEDRPSDSPYVHRVWRSRATGVAGMTSIATSTWELVFWEHRGRTHAAVRGPETIASSAVVPDLSRSFGITFAHGTSMPHLPPARLVDSAVESPHATATTFVLAGDDWPVPGYDSAEQPHLARSLQRFIGRTATELRRPDTAGQPLSLLYKTQAPDGS